MRRAGSLVARSSGQEPLPLQIRPEGAYDVARQAAVHAPAEAQPRPTSLGEQGQAGTQAEAKTSGITERPPPWFCDHRANGKGHGVESEVPKGVAPFVIS